MTRISLSLCKKAAYTVVSFLVLAIVGRTQLHAQPYFTIGNLYYQINADSVSATLVGPVDITQVSGEISIPSTISHNGSDYPVTRIGNNAFISSGGLTGPLNIPNTVTFIGENAFLACSGLTELHLGNSLDTIGPAAFYGCKGFTGSLTLPHSVRVIGTAAFYGCTGFDGTLTFGDGLKRIEDAAFYKCRGFTALNLSDAVTSIGTSAFWGCSGFSGALTLPNSVTEIGGNAFRNCSGFTGTLTLGSALESIGGQAFIHCSGFAEVVSLATEPPAFSFEEVFAGCSCTKLTVPCGRIAAYENSDWHDYFATIVDDCNGVAETDSPMATIYPNPTKGTLTIEAEDMEGIVIYNVLGEKLFEALVSGNRFAYDFSPHEAGVYLVRIRTGKGIVTERVIVE